MHSENSPPWEFTPADTPPPAWEFTAPVAATVGLCMLGIDEQFVLELLAHGYDLKTALAAAGVLSVAAAEFVRRLFRHPSQPSNGAGPSGLLAA